MNENPVALVTNCLGFAGPGSVTGLVEAGYRVFAHDRAFADPQARDGWQTDNAGAIPLAEQEPQSLVARVIEQTQRLDALVSNDIVDLAGKSFDLASADDYRAILEHGSVFPFLVAQAALAHMADRRAGAVIFITSATARDPLAFAPLYSAARAATTALAIALGRAYGKLDIAVNAIGPSWFENPNYFAPGWEEKAPDRHEKFLKHGTLSRLGRQSEMGRLVAFLAGRNAMPITAQYIDFSGNSPA